MQITTTLFDPDEPIPVPCKWGDYTVLAIREIKVNEHPAKLLTIGKWDNQGLPDFPTPINHYDEYGRWLFC
jgi:hypothetical protein